MDKKKNRTVIAGVIILLIVMMIAAVLVVDKLGENIPRSSSTSILLQYTNADGSVPLGATRHADDGNFSFSLTVEPSADCLLMALVDYRVVPFYFDGRYNATHYLTGSPTNNYTGVVSVTNLPEGFHDVLILGLLSPFNYTSGPLRIIDRRRVSEVQRHRRERHEAGRLLREPVDGRQCRLLVRKPRVRHTDKKPV
jgi:hypothetical protein